MCIFLHYVFKVTYFTHLTAKIKSQTNNHTNAPNFVFASDICIPRKTVGFNILIAPFFRQLYCNNFRHVPTFQYGFSACYNSSFFPDHVLPRWVECDWFWLQKYDVFVVISLRAKLYTLLQFELFAVGNCISFIKIRGLFLASKHFTGSRFARKSYMFLWSKEYFPHFTNIFY